MSQVQCSSREWGLETFAFDHEYAHPMRGEAPRVDRLITN